MILNIGYNPLLTESRRNENMIRALYRQSDPNPNQTQSSIKQSPDLDWPGLLSDRIESYVNLADRFSDFNKRTHNVT